MLTLVLSDPGEPKLTLLRSTMAALGVVMMLLWNHLLQRAEPVEHRQGQRLGLAPVEELPLRHRRRGVVPAQLALDLVRVRVRARARAARLGPGRDAANPNPGADPNPI